jgi:hypothetical protein
MKCVRTLAVAVSISLAAGCTAVRVQPVAAAEQIRYVCIQENSKVMVDDFVPVLQDGFRRYGISTEIIQGSSRPERCEYVLTYTALRSWDLAPYLSYAELRIDKGGRAIASAQYRLRGKGGLSLTKWASTKAKIDPVIDELLGAAGTHQVVAEDVTRRVPPAVQADQLSTASTSSIELRLRELQQLKDRNLITDAEYEERRRAILREL